MRDATGTGAILDLKRPALRAFLRGELGTGALLEVQVLPPVGQSERSDAQPQEGNHVWEAGVDRAGESMNKNCIEDASEEGERTIDLEALALFLNGRRP